MKVLALGDVVGQAGCDILRRNLLKIKNEHKINLCIANGENSAEGNGILPSSAAALFEAGVGIITTGNHGLRRREIYEMLDEGTGVIRPANYNSAAHGFGYYIYDMLSYRVAVINLQGTVYMDNIDNPFDCIDRILNELDASVKIVDFHAEATSEKLAMGYYIDGRASLLFGTHTHVQTADEHIYPQGLGYITDLGMCGPSESVLGIKPELALRRLKTHLPTRFDNAEGACQICGAVADIDEKTGKTVKIYRIFIKQD
ncbi:MAG: TIGR00282 family metallophosphoesterase [Hydrogenoanaerobacterium sp.]